MNLNDFLIPEGENPLFIKTGAEPDMALEPLFTGVHGQVEEVSFPLVDQLRKRALIK